MTRLWFRMPLFFKFAKALCCVLATLAGAVLAWSNTWPDLNLSQYVSQKWDIRDGLSQNSISQIAQTDNGFLWLGSQEGVVRFDGFDFRVFDKANTPIFTANEISVLVSDQQGGLWLGFNGGGILHWQNGEFSRPIHDERIINAHIRCLLPDGPGRLYIGTETLGLFLFSKNGLERLAGPFGGQGIRGLAKWGESGLLVGSYGEGVLAYEEGIFRNISLGNYRFANFVNAIVEAPGKGFLVGTDGGLFLISEFAVKTIAHFPENPKLNQIRDVCLGEDHQIWWATDEGVSRYSDGRIEHFNITQEDVPTRVDSVFFDNDENLWVGASGVGLYRFRRGVLTAITSREGLCDDMTWTVLQDQAGTVWVGTDNGGICAISHGKPHDEAVPEQFRKGLVNSAAFDSKGQLWIGKYNGLFKVSNGESKRMGKAGSVLDGPIYPVFVDSQDRIWFGTEESFYSWDGSEITPYESDYLSSKNIFAIVEDGEGNLWIGAAEGLFRIRPDGLDLFRIPSAMPGSHEVLALLPDAGGLWVSDDKLGLGWFENGRFQFLQESDLPQEIPYGIVKDRFGYLWYSSNSGIFRVKEEDVRNFLNGNAKRIPWYRYGLADGMQSVEGNLGGLPTVLKDKGCRLWFTTVKGIVTLDPEKVEAAKPPPTAYVSQVKVDGKPYPVSKEIHLPPLFQSLDIYFGAVEFFDPESIRFRSELQGLDSGDPQVTQMRSAHFTQLPAGKLAFTISSGNALRGFRNSTLFLHVPQTVRQIWRQRAFGFGIFLCIAGLFYLFWRWRKKLQGYLGLQTRLAELRMEEQRRRALLDRTALRLEKAHQTEDKALITTHLLHNVGNILNSVSVSSGMMEKMLRGKEIHGLLEKILKLFVTHSDDLPTFLCNDPQGKRVPQAIGDISEILEDGKVELFHELANLQLQCAHIQDIVKGIDTEKQGLEYCRLQLLIEDALKLQGYLLTKHSITVVRHLDRNLMVLSRRSQLLQILVNLIKNSVESMAMVKDGAARTLTLNSETGPKGTIILEIKDTGMGINPENLTQLFTRGFTTKKYGHGLGLSYCRTMMREMKGEIRVHSDGEGLGACFQLEFLEVAG